MAFLYSIVIICVLAIRLISFFKNSVQNKKSYTYSKQDYFLKKEEYDNQETEIIFFDTETNGLSYKNSVLSIAVVKGYLDLESSKIIVVDIFQRYYYCKEKYSREAIAINNLSHNNVSELRTKTSANYPEYFEDDLENLYNFIGDATHFVAHNIEFDSQFVKTHLDVQFCTMMTNTTIVKAKRFRKGKYKWPKLEEAARYYRIKTRKNRLHDSLYDVELTIKIFERMLRHPVGRDYVLNFLYKNRNYILEI